MSFDPENPVSNEILPPIEREVSIRERIGDLEIQFQGHMLSPDDAYQGATADHFFIDTRDPEIFGLFNEACQALSNTAKLEGMKKPLYFFHQIGPHDTIGMTGFELTEEDLPAHTLAPMVITMIREKMLELAEKKSASLTPDPQASK